MAGATSVDALRPGDHACLTYSDAEERSDIVAELNHAMAVVCRRAVRKMLDLVGATDRPAVRVRLADGRP